MARYRYLREKPKEGTIHSVMPQKIRTAMELIATAREMPIGRVAGEAIEAYCNRPDNKKIWTEK